MADTIIDLDERVPEFDPSPIDLENETELDFTAIHSEQWRRYEFLDVSGHVSALTIIRPQWLHVSRSGGHRILDRDGVSHYIPKGWIHLSWKSFPGTPHFVT